MMALVYRSFREAFPSWWLLGISLSLGGGALLLASNFGFDRLESSSRESYLYLLSAQAETLGTILALVFTATLVAAQPG